MSGEPIEVLRPTLTSFRALCPVPAPESSFLADVVGYFLLPGPPLGSP